MHETFASFFQQPFNTNTTTVKIIIIILWKKKVNKGALLLSLSLYYYYIYNSIRAFCIVFFAYLAFPCLIPLPLFYNFEH